MPGKPAKDLPFGWCVLAILFLAWTSVLIPGFAFPLTNNIFHVPIVLDYASSAEGPKSAFVVSLAKFVSLFWRGLGLIANEDNVWSVFFGAHMLSRIAFIAGIYAILRRTGQSAISALCFSGIAGIAPIFKGTSTVGMTEMLPTYLTHTGFAIALMPLIWWLIFRRNWLLSAALVGTIANINLFLACWMFGAWFFALVAVREEISRPLVRLSLGLAAFLAAASPTLIWTLSVVGDQSLSFDFRAHLLKYHPEHTFVSVQWADLAQYATWLGAAGMSSAFAIAAVARGERRILAGLTIAFATFFVFGIALPFLTDARLLLSLFPLRIDAVLNIALATALLSGAGLEADRGNQWLRRALAFLLLGGASIAVLMILAISSASVEHLFRRRLAIAATGAGLALCAALALPSGITPDFAPLSMLFFCAGLVCLAGAAESSERGGAAVALATVALIAVFGIPDGWSAIALLALGAVFAFALVGQRLARIAANVLAAMWCIALLSEGMSLDALSSLGVLVAGLALQIVGYSRYSGIERSLTQSVWVFAAVVALGLSLTVFAAWRGSVERPDMDFSALRDGQAWARQNMAPREQFLEIDLVGFGVLSRREAWVDRSEVAAAMWEPGFLPTWEQRIAEQRACSDTPCFAALARRHQLRWIVAPPARLAGAKQAGLQLRFRNPLYEIYSVEPASAFAAPAAGKE